MCLSFLPVSGGMSDFSSVLDDIFSRYSDMSDEEDDSVSQSSMDHSEDHHTQLHQNKLVTKLDSSGLKKRKRASSTLGDESKLPKKQRRLNVPKSSAANPETRSSKWNQFTAKITRQYITTLPTSPQPFSSFCIPTHTQQLVLELFASLENCITSMQLTSADLTPARLLAAVTENQRFLPTFQRSNTYGIFFGYDNIGKLVGINPTGLTSQVYVNQIYTKTKDLILNDKQFGEAADKIINVEKCRIFFDHEICFVPNAIYQAVENYSIHTYQRQMLENVFVDFPLRTVLQAQLHQQMTGYYTDILRHKLLDRLHARAPSFPPMTAQQQQQQLDIFLMPPPPPISMSSIKDRTWKWGEKKNIKWKEVSFSYSKK